MNDCTYILYETLLGQHPYVPADSSDLDAAQRLEAALAQTKSFPFEYHHTLFELTDSLHILTYHQSHHAFLLGLDLGLSIARELESFQIPR